MYKSNKKMGIYTIIHKLTTVLTKYLALRCLELGIFS